MVVVVQRRGTFPRIPAPLRWERGRHKAPVRPLVLDGRIVIGYLESYLVGHSALLFPAVVAATRHSEAEFTKSPDRLVLSTHLLIIGTATAPREPPVPEPHLPQLQVIW